MARDELQAQDVDVVLRVYRLCLENTGPSDREYAIEIALLDDMIKSFQGVGFGDGPRAIDCTRRAHDAALALRQAMEALEAARAAESELPITIVMGSPGNGASAGKTAP